MLRQLESFAQLGFFRLTGSDSSHPFWSWQVNFLTPMLPSCQACLLSGWHVTQPTLCPKGVLMNSTLLIISIMGGWASWQRWMCPQRLDIPRNAGCVEWRSKNKQGPHSKPIPNLWTLATFIMPSGSANETGFPQKTRQFDVELPLDIIGLWSYTNYPASVLVSTSWPVGFWVSLSECVTWVPLARSKTTNLKVGIWPTP